MIATLASFRPSATRTSSSSRASHSSHRATSARDWYENKASKSSAVNARRIRRSVVIGSTPRTLLADLEFDRERASVVAEGPHEYRDPIALAELDAAERVGDPQVVQVALPGPAHQAGRVGRRDGLGRIRSVAV